MPKKAKLSEQTSDRLYEMIVDEHRYAPGSKLPNENELSEELQVSRTTLREAISFLVAQGVLEIRRGKGTFVSAALPSEGLDLTGLAGMRSRVRARDLFEMRLIFEPATAALACQRATDEELEQIRKKAERVEEVAAEGATGPWRIRNCTWPSSGPLTMSICAGCIPSSTAPSTRSCRSTRTAIRWRRSPWRTTSCCWTFSFAGTRPAPGMP